MAQGLFIVIEGLDGSGGTTQCRLLAERLEGRGHAVVRTCEPTDGPVGRFIRKALAADSPASVLGDGVLPFLFAADRRDHLDRRVLPALDRGDVVISDRYLHSSLAYQSLSMGPTLWEGLEAVAALNDGFRAPDLCVVLDLPPEACLARIYARGGVRDRFETLPRLTAIGRAYEAVWARCVARGDRIVHVDASQPIEVVHADVAAAVQALP